MNQGYSLRQAAKLSGVPTMTFHSWKAKGLLVADIQDDKGNFSLFSKTQIERAEELDKQRKAKKMSHDDKSFNLFDEPIIDAIKAENTPTIANNTVSDSETCKPTLTAENDASGSLAPVMPVVVETPPYKSEPNITLEGRAARIRGHMQDICNSVIAIGFELIAAKKEIEHGGCGAWLKSEFNWTQQTAENYMRIAERFGNGKIKNVFDFKPSTLIKMLALPEGDEQAFIAAQANEGKPVENQSAREVQKNVRDWKQKRAKQKQSSDTTPVNNLSEPMSNDKPEEVSGTYLDLLGNDKNTTVVKELNQEITNEEIKSHSTAVITPEEAKAGQSLETQTKIFSSSEKTTLPDVLGEDKPAPMTTEKSTDKNFTELIIDDEFKNLLPPLQKHEFDLLEELILQDGILNSLKVWNGILLDGHARYEIAKRHNLPFKTTEITSCSNRADAIIWIIKNHLGRRNLNEYGRAKMVLKIRESTENNQL